MVANRNILAEKSPGAIWDDPSLPKRGVISGIQLLRGAAALAVVAHHVNAVQFQNDGFDPFWSLRDVGSRGVELFFVLSGFIILYAHWNDAGGMNSAKRYAYNRLVRIIPPTFVVATLWIAVAWCAARVGFDVSSMGGIDLSLWLSSALIFPMLKLPSPVVIWTLRHELMFYGLFIFRYVNRALALFLIAAWGVIAFAITTTDGSQFFYTVFLNLNILFMFGVVGYFLWRRERVRSFFAVHAWLKASVAGLIFCTLCFAFRDITDYENYSPLPFGVTGMVLLMSVMPLKFNAKIDHIIRLFGDASFAIYLVHLPIIVVMYKVFAKLHIGQDLAFALLFLTASTGGIIFHLFVEIRITRWFRKRRPEISRATAVSVA